MSETDNYDGPGRRWPKGAVIALSRTTAGPAPGQEALPVHDWVYRSLRRMILYGEIEPGAWLRQKEIADHFQVSRTPVREALRTLAQEGLVEQVPNYGARVTQLSMEEFEEVYALRMGIEGLAARLTAEKITPGQIPSLRQTLDRLQGLTHRVKLPVYLQEEWQFRLQCYRTTGRERLLDHVIFLREHAERYIHLAYNVEARIDESFEFHQRLMAAIEAKQGPLAEQILQSALRWTLTNAGPAVAAIMANSGGP